MHARRGRSIVAVALTGVFLAGCSSQEQNPAGENPAPTVTATATATAEVTEEPAAAAPDPASVRANELGKVPVLMYHQVKPDPRGRFDQSPEEFRAELQRLYDEEYRPVTAIDFVRGEIDIPAGTHPVVLSFDDSTLSQAQIGSDGEPTADSALGILEAFGEENPDFNPTATFYVNNGAFGDPKVLPWLLKNGYEVGAHTVSHANLGELSDDAVQREIAANIAAIETAVPGYAVQTFARPLGIAPRNKTLAYQGSYDGEDYQLTAVMLVGAEPSVSPFAATFDPRETRRILSGLNDVDFDSNYWLDILEKSPQSRYTSDGDPDRISFPSTVSAKLADKWADWANEYTPAGTDESSPSAAPDGAASSPESSADGSQAHQPPSATPTP